MNDYEGKSYKLNVISVAIAAATLLIGAFLAIKSNQATWKIANDSGNFRKGHLSLDVGNRRNRSDDLLTIVIGARHVSKENSIAFGYVPFYLSSVGEMTVEDPGVSFRFHKLFKRKEIAEMTALESAGKDGFSHNVFEVEDHDQSSYEFDQLNPGVGVLMREPMILWPTTINQEVKARSKDGIPLTATMQIETSLNFSAHLSGKDILPQHKNIEIRIVESQSIDSLVDEQRKKIVLVEQARVREQLDFFGYLGSLIFSNRVDSIAFVYIDQSLVSKENGVEVFEPKGFKSMELQFPVFSWGMLFK